MIAITIAIDLSLRSYMQHMPNRCSTSITTISLSIATIFKPLPWDNF